MVRFMRRRTEKNKLEMWANVMAALPNTGGALCSTPQSLANAQYWIELECGPMPNIMAALPTTSGALCSTPQIG